MRLEMSGERRVHVDGPVDDVRGALATADALFDLAADLLHEHSTPTRWVIRDLHLGPAHLDPAVNIEVVAEDGVQQVHGTPVAGHTPSWLRIDMHLASDGDGRTALRSSWDVIVEVPGPQVLAPTLRPIAAASVGRTAERLLARLQDRFAAPAG